MPFAIERLKRVSHEIGEHLGQLMLVAGDQRQFGRHVDGDADAASRHL